MLSRKTADTEVGEYYVLMSAARDIPTLIFLSTPESRALSLLMLDYIAEANQEKAAVLGVFLVFLIFAFACGKTSGISQALDELTRIIIVAVRKKEAEIFN